jgi:hypothetical protein
MTPLDPARRRIAVARHEAAHCCVARRLGVAIDYVTLAANDDYEARVQYPPSFHTAFAKACTLLAGCVAGARFLDCPIGAIVLDGSRSDLVAACKALMDQPPPRKDLGQALEATIALVDQELFNGNIQELAEALLREKRLDADQIEAVLAKQQARNWASPRWDGETLGQVRRSQNLGEPVSIMV